MQIFVRDVNGKTFTLQVAGQNTIHDVAIMISAHCGLDLSMMRLTFAHHELMPRGSDLSRTLSEFGISDVSVEL